MSLFSLKKDKCPEGTKPMLVFAGELFDTDNEHKRLKNVLTGNVPSILKIMTLITS